MKKTNPCSQWIEAGYQEFALNGPDFSLKALSKKANLPRATFYYHFDDKKDLVERILQKHVIINKQYLTELHKIEELHPDFYILLFKFRDSVRFHQQLLRNCHVTEYCKLYYSINFESIRTILPHLRLIFGTEHGDEEIINFYNTLTDAWYTRLNFANLSVEYMQNLAEEILENTLGLYQNAVLQKY